MTTTIAFYAQFISSGVGADGLSVVWDVERIARADGTRSALVTGAATNIAIGRRGLYGYYLTGVDLTLYDYVATAITGGTADQKEIAALWSEWSLPGAPQSGDSYAVVTDSSYGNAKLVRSATPTNALAVDASGQVTTGALANEAITADVIAGAAVTKIQAGLALAATFAGITSLANWLRGILRKDAMDAAAKAEINTGGGTFDEATDSQEAIRDTPPMGTEMRGTDGAALSGEAASAVAGLAVEANVESHVSNALNSYDPPTKEEMDVALEALGDISVTVDLTPVPDLVLDEVIEVGDGASITLRQALRAFLAVLAGKSSGGGTTTDKFYALDGTTVRVTATVDEKGNRSAVVLDVS